MQLLFYCGKCTTQFIYDIETKMIQLSNFFICGCDYQKNVKENGEEAEKYYIDNCKFPKTDHTKIKKHCYENCSLYLQYNNNYWSYNNVNIGIFDWNTKKMYFNKMYYQYILFKSAIDNERKELEKN